MTASRYPPLFRKILSSTLPFYLAGYGTAFLFALLKIPFLTTVFSAADMGNYAFITTLLAYIEVVFFSWLSGTIWRFVYEKHFPAYRLLAATALPLLVAMGLIAALSTYILSVVINIPGGRTILVYAFFSSFTNQFISFFLNYFLFKKQIRTWCMLICIQNVIGFLILIGLIVYTNAGIEAIFMSTLICNGMILIYFICRYISVAFSAGSFNLGLIKTILPYSSMLILSNICYTVLNNGDRLIIDNYKGKQQLGIYSQNYSLASVGFFAIVQFFSLLFIPLYNKSLVDKSSETNKKIIQLYFLLVTPLLSFFIANSSVFTDILFGKEFRGYSSIFNWIAAGIYCFGFTNFFEIRLKFLNKIKLTVIITAAHAVLNLVLNAWLLKNYSIETAAIITFASYFLMLCVFIILNRPFFTTLSLEKYLPDVILQAVLFLVVAILLKQTFLNNWFILVINGIAALIIYPFFLRKHFHIIKYCAGKIAYKLPS